MLIKYMKLKNFRQYIDTTIEFATDSERNVTVIMGDNGTGKTTLAQAFQWALYGKTNFQIHELINRNVREQMGVGGSEKVSVVLNIEYNNQEYMIQRIQEYYKNVNQKIEEKEAKFMISQTDEMGNMKYFPEGMRNHIIKQLLPQDLSNFFFFDGEKIEEMSKEIQAGKSKDFQNAVYSLVGLTATQNTIEHLKSYSKKCVIKEIQREIDKNATSLKEMEKKNDEIDRKNEEMQKDKQDVEQLKMLREKLEKEKEGNMRLILEGQSDMQIKNEFRKLDVQVDKLTVEKNRRTKEVLQSISRNFYEYCLYGVAKKAEPLIEDDEPEECAIPDLTTRTIDALLQRGECICGTSLCEGQLPYKKLINLREFSYPKTIASLKTDYDIHLKQARRNSDFATLFEEKMKSLEECASQLEGTEEEREEKQVLMADTSSAEKALHQNKEIENQLPKINQSIGRLEQSIIDCERQIRILENAKNSLLINSEEVQKKRLYLEYAKSLYESLSTEYKSKEDFYRNKLQNRMNEIFASIYGPNIQISVDAKYRITVRIDEELASTDEVERNTAQGYALIFTFISAIIDLAKKKVNDEALQESDFIDEDKEGYPLVMDAPLSAFDKSRIEKICTEIPKIADQVIIFIKDTDGEVAEMHMKEKIGRQYIIEAVNDSNLHSQVAERR